PRALGTRRGVCARYGRGGTPGHRGLARRALRCTRPAGGGVRLLSPRSWRIAAGSAWACRPFLVDATRDGAFIRRRRLPLAAWQHAVSESGPRRAARWRSLRERGVRHLWRWARPSGSPEPHPARARSLLAARLRHRQLRLARSVLVSV